MGTPDTVMKKDKRSNYEMLRLTLPKGLTATQYYKLLKTVLKDVHDFCRECTYRQRDNCSGYASVSSGVWVKGRPPCELLRTFYKFKFFFSESKNDKKTKKKSK